MKYNNVLCVRENGRAHTDGACGPLEALSWSDVSMLKHTHTLPSRDIRNENPSVGYTPVFCAVVSLDSRLPAPERPLS